MNNTDLNHILKGTRYLDIKNLDKNFGVELSHITTSKSTFFIDLSQVGHAELSALSKLLLILSEISKKAHSSNLFLALPTKTKTESELESEDFEKVNKKYRIISNRFKTNNFLKTTGFTNAILKICQINNCSLLVTEKYNFQSSFEENNFYSSFDEEYLFTTKELLEYKYLLPFTIININDDKIPFEEIEQNINKVLSNPERGLNRIDVDILKNVIFYELIKNVQEHSDSEIFIFTIGLISSTSLLKQRQYRIINPVEADYLDWIKSENISSQVEIYFGDIGRGLLNTNFEKKHFEKFGIKSKEDALKWSFDRWSTIKDNEPRRGTKGLYRIKRIINLYNGIFHISTQNHTGGFVKGGHNEAQWNYVKEKIALPGTFIQMKLCPFNEIKDFRFTLSSNSLQREWSTIYTKQNQLDVSIEKIKEFSNLLLIIDLKEVDDFKEFQNILFDNFPRISYLSHPCSVVVYLLTKFNNDLIRLEIESINEWIKNQTKTDSFDLAAGKINEDIYDPILVIGQNNEAFWYGGNQFLIDILNQAYSNYYSNFNINDLDIYSNLHPDFKIRIRQKLENDTRLVQINNTGVITFNFSSLDITFRNQILKSYENNSYELPPNYLFCSPRLEILEKWIDVFSLLQNKEYGFAFTLYLKAKAKLDTLINKKTNTYILIDHIQQMSLAIAFSNLYGIKNENIINVSVDINPNIPRRSKLFPKTAQVIVMTTIISSSESVRRLVKFAKRDMASPILILCLANYRKTRTDKLMTWDDQTPIYSIYQKHQEEKEKLIKDDNYYIRKNESLNSNKILFIGPNLKIESKQEYEFDNHKLIDYLTSIKAFHYNHIGVYRNRHFTFYLNKKKTLRDRSFIWDKLENTINTWKLKNEIKEFYIYVDRSLFSENPKESNLFKFLNSLSSKKVFVIDELPDQIEFELKLNIFYFDFGVITGKTINKILNSWKQIDNLFICILFDQSQNDEFNFYKRLKFISNENQLLRTEDTKVQIDFLFKLNLNHFNSESCPICDHGRALEEYKVDLEYMYNFSEDRQKKLRLISSEMVEKNNFPFDFYFDNQTSNEHELSSEIIKEMFLFKNLLEFGLRFTQGRIQLYKYLYNLSSNLTKEIKNPESKIYAIVYFLSLELHWMQKEPLVFRDFRIIISKICEEIVFIDLRLLERHFSSSTSKLATTGYKSAIRYKYSAITLFRSSNKYLYCNSLSKILLSSFNGNRYSNNLFQNTCYHIISLFKNKYNRSKKYFESISHQISVFKDSHSKFIKENNLPPEEYFDQLITIEFIENITEHVTLETDVKRIIKLKSNAKKYYKHNHPYQISSFSNINLSQIIDEAINDLRVNGRDSIYYEDYLATCNDIKYNWQIVAMYLTSSIQILMKDLSKRVKSSSYFNTLFWKKYTLDLFEGDKIIGKTDDFSTYIDKIDQDPLSYIFYKNEYDNIYNIISKDLILRDSKFLVFLDSFPCNIKEVLQTNLIYHLPKAKIKSKSKDYFAFYPTFNFKLNCDYIYDNLTKRLNKNKLLKDVNCTVEILENLNYIHINISYDCTDENNNNSPNKNGGLSQIKDDALNFGGDLNYKTKTDSTGIFSLEFKLLKYE